MEFREKEGYKPDVKLDYVDDAGRTMTPKEAFRMLSHRFHGKGSGKKKTEKRMKKIEEDQVDITDATVIICLTHLRMKMRN
jgi:U4/U6.U5 tri-snRNP-associated protein 1